MITAQALLDEPPPIFGCRRCEEALSIVRQAAYHDHIGLTTVGSHGHVLIRRSAGWERTQ